MKLRITTAGYSVCFQGRWSNYHFGLWLWLGLEKIPSLYSLTHSLFEQWAEYNAVFQDSARP